MEQQLIDLGIRLAEALAKNTASAVATKIKLIKTKEDDKERINELEEIIQELISDKNELTQIAQAYQQELSAQKISEAELNYITESFIPKLQEFIQASGNNQELMNAMSILAPLVSKETLTIFQLLGFNFKKAIGEPLTEVVQQMILTKLPPNAEMQKMQLEVQLETVKALRNNPKLITKLGNQ
ncbi:hypothetical protein [Alysiella filiformis]|uniref:Uncharacterized protein n=1 Tax=Alysiella filiformis DSM 16848 TaxID=1120981 RepID=A0A286E1Y3_9NEIS|nr:hypothetical protein [Alysiella filiformis]QMT30822.1 hypothetical protein H3L97_08755 [Alysiella filiformis]UBQ56197.1 hypothetical protein JF568_11720 [Alysiella filiformis DSM 16848]SOD64905.1 hypothetical protein SAMN02746062_00100 [Alysiella filiformis DSM 16848]